MNFKRIIPESLGSSVFLKYFELLSVFLYFLIDSQMSESDIVATLSTSSSTLSEFAVIDKKDSRRVGPTIS